MSNRRIVITGLLFDQAAYIVFLGQAANESVDIGPQCHDTVVSSSREQVVHVAVYRASLIDHFDEFALAIVAEFDLVIFVCRVGIDGGAQKGAGGDPGIDQSRSVNVSCRLIASSNVDRNLSGNFAIRVVRELGFGIRIIRSRAAIATAARRGGT